MQLAAQPADRHRLTRIVLRAPTQQLFAVDNTGGRHLCIRRCRRNRTTITIVVAAPYQYFAPALAPGASGIDPPFSPYNCKQPRLSKPAVVRLATTKKVATLVVLLKDLWDLACFLAGSLTIG